VINRKGFPHRIRTNFSPVYRITTNLTKAVWQADIWPNHTYIVYPATLWESSGNLVAGGIDWVSNLEAVRIVVWCCRLPETVRCERYKECELRDFRREKVDKERWKEAWVWDIDFQLDIIRIIQTKFQLWVLLQERNLRKKNGPAYERNIYFQQDVIHVIQPKFQLLKSWTSVILD